MPHVWLPGQEAEQFEFARPDANIRYFTKRLQTLDARFDCLLATQDYPDHDVWQGYFYVRRHNEDGTTAMWQIQHEDGSPREPDEAVIEAFRQADAGRTKEGGLYHFQKEQQAYQRKQAREAERQREEKFDRLKDETDYAFRVQHAIKRKPWEL